MNLLERVRRTHAPSHPISLRFLDTSIVILGNDASVVDRLRAYFAPWVAERGGPGAHLVYALHGEPLFDRTLLADVPRVGSSREPKESYYDTPSVRVVRKNRTGVTVYVADGAHAVIGDLKSHFNQLVNATTMVFTKAMLDRGYALLHASAVSGPAGGLAFASASGSGKSTSALALVEAGRRFVTNDRLLIKARGTAVAMIGVPKLPRVNPGTLLRSPHLARLLDPAKRSAYGALDRDTLWRIEDKHDVDVNTVYGHGTFQLTGRLRAVVLLHWALDQDGWEVREVSGPARVDALRPVAKSLGIFDRDDARDVQQSCALEQAAHRLSVYEVHGRVDVERLRQWTLASGY